MVKLLIKDYKVTKAQTNHFCNFCESVILKGTFYRKYNDPISINLVKLHEHCFKELCIKAIQKNADDLLS